MNAETLNRVANSGIWSIIEFTSIAAVIIVAYLAMHTMFYRMKSPTKMLLAMFMGTLAYSVGKFILITIIFKPLIL